MANIVSRDDMLEIFVALGYKLATKWNVPKMNEKLGPVVEMAKADKEMEIDTDEDLNKIFRKIVELDGQIKISPSDDTNILDIPTEDVEEATIDIENEEEVEEEEVKDEPKKKRRRSKKVKDEEAKEESKKKRGRPKKSEEAKEEPKDKTKEKKSAKIKSLQNREFFAGVVLKKYGFGIGITDEMVEEVDSMVGGKLNSRQSRSVLTNAWRAIDGYLNG